MSATEGLAARLVVEVGTLEIRAGFEVQRGEVLALLGPNGAGKTTILRAMAGLQPITEGEITVGGVVLEDAEGEVFVEPDRRRVGLVPQDHVLFPNLSVLDNVGFGLRSRGSSTSEARAVARGWLERVGLSGLADKGQRELSPRDLSGGQSQRVALVRALATEPDLLLLDEPLSALDVSTRAALRRELRAHLEAFRGCTVLVSHDPIDALALADRIAVIEDGSITQEGTVGEVSARPRTPYVADLVGVNLLHGRSAGAVVDLDDSREALALADELDVAAGEPVLAVIRPRSVSLHRQRPDTSARNSWEFTVAALDMLAGHVRARLAGPFDLVAEVTPAAVEDLQLREGSPVWASVKATEVTAFAE